MTTKKNTAKQLLGAALVAGLVGMGCGRPEAPARELVPTTNEEHNQMLEGLGFSTDIGPRTDNEGEDLPEAWHPLGQRYAAFFPKKEMYLAGVDLNGASEMLLDDAVEEFRALELRANPDDSWTDAQYKNAISADMDADGFDEMLVVFFAPGSSTLKYIFMDPNDDTPAILGVLDAGADATGLDYRAQPSLAAGDLDRDGRAEVAVGFGKLYLLSDLADGSPSVISKAYLDKNDVMVAIGNTDLDPADELVVTHTETVGAVKGYYEIIDEGEIDSPTQIGDLVVTDRSNADHGYAEARVAIGDVDGDRVGDVIFHGRRPADNAWSLFILRYDPYDDGYFFRSFLHDVHTSAQVPWTLVPLDIDGDSIDEIFAWDEIVQVEEDGTASTRISNLPTWSRAVAANVDSDRREELVMASKDRYAVYGMNELDEFDVKKYEHGIAGAFDSPALAVGNIDGDSPIVRFDGEHELLFTQPHVLSLLSVPPYWKGVGQDVDSTTATYGETESSTVVSETSMGFSVGFSVGYGYENDLFGTGFEARASFESAFDYYASQSETREQWYSHTTAPGEDKVVFSTVPFDVYYYTIVSSPNPDEVGRVVTVNMPRNQQVLGASIDFYNAHNGGGTDIDDEVLGHRAGDPWSYPTLEDRDRILGNAEITSPGYLRLWNGPIQVDQSGSNSLGLSTSEGSARGGSVDLSAEFSFEVQAGGAIAGTSVGFHYGYSYELSTEQGAFYEGTVGGLPGDVYADRAYCYGLMVYPKITGDQHFVTLDWWTQRRCGGE